MGAEANALPDSSRATEARRNDAAGAEGHGTRRRGSAKAVPEIKREGGRCCCTDSKTICGRYPQRSAVAASRFPVRAADCLLEPGHPVARAIDRAEKREDGSAGDGHIPVANRI